MPRGTVGLCPEARFDNVGSLKERAPVTMAGVRIGRVETIGYDKATYEALVTCASIARYDTSPLTPSPTSLPPDCSASSTSVWSRAAARLPARRRHHRPHAIGPGARTDDRTVSLQQSRGANDCDTLTAPCVDAPLVVTLATGASAFAAPEAASAMVKDTSERMLSTLQARRAEVDRDPSLIYRMVASILVPHFDFERITQSAVGRHWRRPPPTSSRSSSTGSGRCWYGPTPGPAALLRARRSAICP